MCDKARLITRTARSSIASPQARTDWGTGHAQTAQNQDSKSRGFCLSVPSVSIANQRVPVCLFLFKVKKGMCFRHSPTSSDSSQTLPAWLLRGEGELREVRSKCAGPVEGQLRQGWLSFLLADAAASRITDCQEADRAEGRGGLVSARGVFWGAGRGRWCCQASSKSGFLSWL